MTKYWLILKHLKERFDMSRDRAMALLLQNFEMSSVAMQGLLADLSVYDSEQFVDNLMKIDEICSNLSKTIKKSVIRAARDA